jgi:YesN/AraC family two-component response regulator
LADNGKTGLEVFRKVNCVVVIVDIFMPVMDGFAFLKAIKPSHGAPYEVIAVTGNSDSETIRKCFAFGASHLLVKPLNFTQVKELVKRIWTKKQNQKDILESLQKKIKKLEKINLEEKNKTDQISLAFSKIENSLEKLIPLKESKLAQDLETLKSLIPKAKKMPLKSRENNEDKTFGES